jgi:hypothetical protein
MKTILAYSRSIFVALMSATLSFSIPNAQADIPDRAVTDIKGIYKVGASNDPLFPIGDGREWFLDFGSGLTSSTSSGTVTVSLRQNPKVSVHPMVWQFFPGDSTLAIGNQYERGARQAVAKGVWKISQTQDGLVLDREGVRLILFRPEPGDY